MRRELHSLPPSPFHQVPTLDECTIIVERIIEEVGEYACQQQIIKDLELFGYPFGQSNKSLETRSTDTKHGQSSEYPPTPTSTSLSL